MPASTSSDAADSSTRGLPPRFKNVLYILADDLRPEFHFTDPQLNLITPNFDRLSREGAYFGLAFAQVAFCVPSRTSFLTGMRPETTRSLDNDQIMRFGSDGNEPLKPGYTVFDAFRSVGYTTGAVGKIFHVVEDHPALSHPMLKETVGLLQRPCDDSDAKDVMSPDEWVFGVPKVCSLPFGRFVDQRVAHWARVRIGEFAKLQRPWLLAVGFMRPHNPFHFPVQYLTMQAPSNATHLARVRFRHASQPSIAYGNNPMGCRSRTCEQQLRRFYHGAVSYIDSLLGSVLYKLQELDLERSTLVVMHADHSTSLGENGAFQKRSLFDHATRVPLFIRDPMRPDSAGQRIHVPVELVDVLPTLLDISGVKRANSGLPSRLEGRSLSQLLNPTAAVEAPTEAGRSSSSYPPGSSSTSSLSTRGLVEKTSLSPRDQAGSTVAPGGRARSLSTQPVNPRPHQAASGSLRKPLSDSQQLWRPAALTSNGTAKRTARAKLDWRYAFMLQPRLLYLTRTPRREPILGYLIAAAVAVNDSIVLRGAWRHQADLRWIQEAASVAQHGSHADAAPHLDGTQPPGMRKVQPTACDRLELKEMGFGEGIACRFVAMGFSVRSRYFRYTRWERWPPGNDPSRNVSVPMPPRIWTVGEGAVLAEELYNYSAPPDASTDESNATFSMVDGNAEEINLLASSAANSSKIVHLRDTLLRALLRKRARFLNRSLLSELFPKHS